MSEYLQNPTATESALEAVTASSDGPGWMDRQFQRLVEKYLARIKHGALVLITPDGQEKRFGDAAVAEPAHLRVNDWSFFKQLALGSDVAFGEMYMNGLVSSNNLTKLLTLFCDNQGYTHERGLITSKISQLGNRVLHLLRENTITGSKKNIQAHYDLSNEFFATFLDETMTYSAALWRDEKQTLKEAQLEKIHTLLRKADIKPEHHILEIGSGWGTLAIEAVKSYGCRVTTITLSEEQFAYAKKRFEEEGLSDRIDIQLIDYRKVEGKFDRIVSVEMLEAVGEKYLGTYFNRCDELLNDGGHAVIQVITLADQRFAEYRSSTDWIQKYIFPGCLVPSLSAINDAVREHSRFVIDDIENIGLHYARTLREWRQVFLSKLPEIKALGFDDRFCRMWEYYLCYCEAGFATRVLNDLHLVLVRPQPVMSYGFRKVSG